MPGTMFISASSLAALPTSGSAWDRLVDKANDTVPAGNLSANDQTQPLDIFSIALRWAKDGGGGGKQYVVDHIKAVMGTESSAGDNYPARVLGAYIAAADLVDMDGTEVGANGMTFNAWIQAWPNLTITNAPAAYNTLYKAARTGSHYYGSFARASLLACALWMIKKGLDPTGTGSAPTTATALRDEVINYFKRWAGDTSVPNTFQTTTSYNAAWAVNTFPTTQGVVNPVVADLTKSGANVADASYSGPPPLTGGAGHRNTLESQDAAAFTIILLINAGYADAAGYGNNGPRRVYEFLKANNLTAANADFDKWRAHQAWWANYMWNLDYPIHSVIDGSQRRLLTTHLDWLTTAGSTWLTTTGGGGGGGGETPPEPVITAPTVSFTVSRTNQTVTVNAAGTTQGTGTILRHEITWGDGSAVQTLTEPTRTANHLYTPPSNGANYTITVKAVASDGGEATAVQSVAVPGVSGAPVVTFVVSKTLVAPGEAVPYSFVGTQAPTEGATLTYTVDWGDGTVETDVPITGTHVYADVADPTSFTILGTASSD